MYLKNILQFKNSKNILSQLYKFLQKFDQENAFEYKVSLLEFSKYINKGIYDIITELKYFHSFYSVFIRFINKGFFININDLYIFI